MARFDILIILSPEKQMKDGKLDIEIKCIPACMS